jgi:hypothetical protein
MNNEIRLLELEAQLDNQEYSKKKCRLELLKLKEHEKKMRDTIASLDEAIVETKRGINDILEAESEGQNIIKGGTSK